jgi:hypothetical protein
MTKFADENEEEKPPMMALFRMTGLPDDAHSEWVGARRAEEAMERSYSDRSERSYGND